jgi:hypothetical protein
VTSERWIGKDLEGSGRGPILRNYPDISLEGLRKTTNILSQDNRSLREDNIKTDAKEILSKAWAALKFLRVGFSVGLFRTR